MTGLDPAVTTLPLAFHDRWAQVDHDPEVLAARLAQHYSLLDFGPRSRSAHAFLHRSVSASAGELMLTCGYTSPIQGTIGERAGVASINLCRAGGADYQVDGRALHLAPEQPLLFIPGHEYRYSADAFNGLVFHLDLARLKRTAAAIAGFGASPRRFEVDLEAPRVLGLEAGGGMRRRLLRLLERQFALLDDPELEGAPEQSHLGLEDVFYRCLALLLCPRLISQEALAAQDGPVSARERRLEQLLEWIRGHLHEPISLTVLEQRSGYSRRNLQLAFQQRFGCGPIQWIRRQRLELARQALLSGQTNDSVSTIARRCGFNSVAVFSRDFSAQYGLRPSHLLREGRQRYD